MAEILLLLAFSCVKRVHAIFPFNSKSDNSITWGLESVQTESSGMMDPNGVPSSSNIPVVDHVLLKDEDVVTQQPSAMTERLLFNAERLPSSDLIGPITLEDGEIMAQTPPAMDGMLSFDTEELASESDYSPASSTYTGSPGTPESLSGEDSPNPTEESEEVVTPSCWLSCCGFCLECSDGLLP